MTSSPFEAAHDTSNPLDMVEDFVAGKGWACARHDDDLMTVVVQGQKEPLEICMEWQDEFSALLFACSVPLEIKEEQYDIAARALEHINQNMWMGHFDLSNKGKFPTFRYTLLCRLIPASVAVEIVADILEIALSECHRFHGTFQLIHTGDARLQDNLQAAIFDTVGEA